MKRKELLKVCYHGKTVGTLGKTHDDRSLAFEYDTEWLAKGFSISPLELPLKSGVFVAKPTPFRGNFGIFEDSLPDGYGRFLLHKTLQQNGIDDRSLTTMDLLSIVGSSGMGALTYEPSENIIVGDELTDFDLLQQKALDVLRERQDRDAGLLLYNSRNSGGCRPKSIYSDADGHWLVKFRHTYDPMDMGAQEYHYNEIARKCGINVPDFKLVAGRYFACKRFDIAENGERIHTATAGGLLCVPISSPVLDYSNLLALTGFLTQSSNAVEEMFRRMVFNYITENKDDHGKNFSFLVREQAGNKFKWQIAPAYDLTYCHEGYNGQHATSVNGTGFPTLEDFVAVGEATKMSRKRCLEIFDEVWSNCGDLRLYDIKKK